MEKKSLVGSTRFEESQNWDILGIFDDEEKETREELSAMQINQFEGDDIETSNEPMSARSAACIMSPSQTAKCAEKNVTDEGKPQQKRQPSSTKESRGKTKSSQPNSTNKLEFEDFVGMISTEEQTSKIHRQKKDQKSDHFVGVYAKSPASVSIQIDKKIEEKNEGFSSDGEDSEMSENEYNRNQSRLGWDSSTTTAPTLLSPPSKANSVNQGDHHKDLTKKVPVKTRKSEPFSPSSGTYPIIPERKIGVHPSKEGTNSRVRSDIGQSGDIKNGDMSRVFAEEAYSTQQFDSLPELKRGTPFLKFGKQGFPHFRQFNISQNNDELIWFSNKKKLEQSSIRIKDISEILIGQNTKEFRRMSWTTLTTASFTIWHSGHKRSLNLVAKSVDEMKMWVEALRVLQDKASHGEDLSKLRSLEVSIDFKDRNRPQSRRHSGSFVRSHETKEKEVDPSLHRRLVGDLKTISKLFQEVKELAQNEAVQKSHEDASIKQILSELEERIEELNEEIVNTRNTKIAENDVWRTRVDLKSLKEKILVVVRESNKKSKRRFSVF